MSKARKPYEIAPSRSSFTVYTPPVVRRSRYSLEPVDLVVIVVGASLIMFGIRPFFELIVLLGDWLSL